MAHEKLLSMLSNSEAEEVRVWENSGTLGARGRRGSDTAPRPPEVLGLRDDVDAAMVETTRTLRRFLSERRAQALAVAPAYAALWEAVADQVGGKLVRPRLTVASYLGFGGTNVGAIASVAAAQELLHTAMLVHDDVLDSDEVRRGAPNITGTYRARLAADGVFGAAAEHQLLGAGLLGGDLALSAAFELLASSSASPEIVVEAVRALARTVATTVAGELLDVGGELLSPFAVDPLLVGDQRLMAGGGADVADDPRRDLLIGRLPPGRAEARLVEARPVERQRQLPQLLASQFPRARQHRHQRRNLVLVARDEGRERLQVVLRPLPLSEAGHNLEAVEDCAVLLTVLPEVARDFAEYRMLIFGLVMVLMMMWRPQGLLPATRPHVELPQ